MVEDSFLYTENWNDHSTYCINIADPESIFVHRTVPYFVGSHGLEIINGYGYAAGVYLDFIPDMDDYDVVKPYYSIGKADLINSAEPVMDSIYASPNRYMGSIASNGSYIFYVNTELSDYNMWGSATYTIGETHLRVWGEDYSYTWDELEGEGSFGIDAISDILLAVGFEHGFSILNYEQPDAIREVAYYRNPDSSYYFTHFALKENRLYAMAHFGGRARLYMFELSDSVIDGLFEAPVAVPARIGISAYPNPFNSSVEITVGQTFLSVQNGQTGMSDLPVTIEIYDLQGNVVYAHDVGVQNFEPLPNGIRTFIWQPDKNIPSGIYLVRATVGDQTNTKRAILIR